MGTRDVLVKPVIGHPIGRHREPSGVRGPRYANRGAVVHIHGDRPALGIQRRFAREEP